MYKRKMYEPRKIVTYNAENSIKAAAEVKNANLYAEIKDLDLISKEFKVHKHCYREFTRDTGIDAGENPLTYDKGNFEAVESCVAEDIVRLGMVVTLKHLHGLYGLGVGDSRYKSKLKDRLYKRFGDSITILYSQNKDPSEVVISSECIDRFITCTPDDTLEKAAKIIADDTLEKFKDYPEVSWPPSTEELSKESWKPPPSVYTFLKALFRHKEYNYITAVQKRWIDSFAYDLTYGITNGQTMQLKHFLLAIGLHDLTGSRKVVDIVHNLGHCISYNTTCEIKTAIAENVLEQANKSDILPLKPLSEECITPTFFWVDNFDVQIDCLAGGGSVNTTHLMAFQEPAVGTEVVKKIQLVPRRKSRQLFYEDVNLPILKIDKKKEPPIQSLQHDFSYSDTHFNTRYFIWTYLRKVNSFDQTVPTFKAWLLQVKDSTNVGKPIKTFETFLPPITSKVTDFSTIQQYLRYVKGLSKSANMPYVNVTLDVGAAMNAFKTVWNHPDIYQDVIIHLGGFHFLKENFQVIVCKFSNQIAGNFHS